MNSNDYASVVSDLSVIMSKFEVTRPYNFHEVLKTSVIIAVRLTISVHVQVNNRPFMLLVIHYLKCGFRPVNFTCQKFDVRRPCSFHKVLKTSVVRV